MGKYSNALSKRLRHSLKPFKRISQEAFWDRFMKGNGAAASVVGGKLAADAEPSSTVMLDFLEYTKDKEHYTNGDYDVIVDKKCDSKQLRSATFLGHPLWYLRIYSYSRLPIHDWTVIQEIKNEIIGTEYEGIELYPAQSRIMNKENCFHLWILAPNQHDLHPPQFRLGFNMASKLAMRKSDFEREKQKLIDSRKMTTVIIINDELENLSQLAFPHCDHPLQAVEKYVEAHPEIVACLEHWQSQGAEQYG
jgi:hypothetical protein